jgi:two-component system, cell cycle sensor histidine kinase and response regulator CckA
MGDGFDAGDYLPVDSEAVALTAPIHPVQVLLVEDSEADALLIERQLRDQGFDPRIHRVETETELREALGGRWDVVLADYSLPGFGGPRAVALIREHIPQVPVIVISGTVGEEELVATMKAGAADYVLKDKLSRLGPAIRRELQDAEATRLQQEQSLKRLAASEGRYRALMEQANDAILILEPGHYVLEANLRAEQILGRPRAEIVGRHYDEFVVPDEQMDSARRQEQLLADGTLRVERRQLMRADGTRVSVEVSASVVRLGEESAVFTILRDITERRRSEEALRRSEARMKSVLDAALDAVIMMDEEGLVVSWNTRAEQLFGWAPDEAIGARLPELIIPPRYRADHTRGLKTFLATGEGPVIGRRTELSALRRDGSEFPVELTVTALKEGRAFYFNAFVADITERKQAEQEIVERMELAAFTSDIGTALTRDEPLPVVLQRCAEAMMRHLEPAFARIWTLNRAGDTLELQASAGMYTHLDGAHARVPVGRFKIGLIAAEREPHLTNDVIHDPRVSDPAWARREGMVAFAGYPLVVGDQLVGVMAMFSRHPLSSNVLGSMAAVANQIALGIKRQRSEEDHRASEEQYRLLFESNPHSMWVYDEETLAFLAVNDAALHHYGYSRHEFLAMGVLDIHPPEDVPAFRQEYEAFMAQREPGRSYQSPHSFKHRKKDGAIIEVDMAANPIVFEGRKAWLLLATDVTEKRSLEAQLLQSQKMESMGRLAGGVAHDFNNLLGIITGYGELLRKRVAADPRLIRYVDDIVKAAERAAGLTRQLLAFSRKQVLQPRILDLNAVVAETEKMLRRLIGEDIHLMTVLDEHVGPVRADPGQMNQVLMNLAVNARDAMPRGGRLTIETGNVMLDQEYARQHAGVAPGHYVMLSVSDTGHGMTPEVRTRVFEPFFTTKDPGKGTGLGLATVHGIVQQSGGHIWVYSEPGHGTTFKVYLPRTDVPRLEVGTPAPARIELPRGSETILLVEDEASLRELVRECLEASGYTLLEASHGTAALEISEHHPGRIDLLMTDVVMPGMSGRELAERLRASRPEIRTVYMSGYTDDAVVLHGVVAEDMAFLQKPFTAAELAGRVREVLDRTAGK